MSVRGIRGAITVSENSAHGIEAATRRLLCAMVEHNAIQCDEIVSVLFSLTADLCAQFPAVAAREMGWSSVPMLHVREIDVPGSLTQCIRVLLHANTEVSQRDIEHVYLDGAARLRPDLVQI